MDGVSTLGKPTKLSEVEHLQFKIYDFAKLNKIRAEFVQPPSLHAHDYDWTIRLYPRGSAESNEDNEYVSIFLEMTDLFREETVDVPFAVRVGTTQMNAEYRFRFGSKGSGWKNFKRRDELIRDDLDKTGTLVVAVEVSVYKEIWTWYPPKLNKYFKSGLAKMLKSPTNGDVKFMVSGKEFRLHRCVLAMNAPAMCGLCTDSDQTITLENVDPQAFDIMVHHIYLGECPESLESAEVAKTLLQLTHKYGCVSLKLFVESLMVDKFIDNHNAAEMLLLAHSLSFALLKEAALQLCIEQMNTVRETDGWKEVMESKKLTEEIILASNQRKLVLNDIDRISIAELRDLLLEKDQSVDGNREMLVNRLKECGWPQDNEISSYPISTPSLAESPKMGGATTPGNLAELSEIEHLRFKIYDFSKMDQQRSEFLELPSLYAHGYDWTIRLYPRGAPESNEDDEYVSLSLEMTDCGETVDVRFAVRAGTAQMNTDYCFRPVSTGRGWKHFKRREELIRDDLDKTGALVVAVEISVYKMVSKSWCPPKPPLKLYTESLMVDKCINKSNAAEMLLFAHYNSCALLKEAAMQLCIEHIDTVRKSEPWKEVMESIELVEEIMLSSSQHLLALDDFDFMSVTASRDFFLEEDHSVTASRDFFLEEDQRVNGWRFLLDGELPDDELV